MSNDDSVRYWECLLNRGWHVAATGGSDSHWMSIVAFQGLGNPTTWVFAPERSARGVLDAACERAAPRSRSQTPVERRRRQLLLEADADRDGVYESLMGDTVPGGTPMRVRALGLASSRPRADPLATHDDCVQRCACCPAAPTRSSPPSPAGWVRATLFDEDDRAARTQNCDKPLNGALQKARPVADDLLPQRAALPGDDVADLPLRTRDAGRCRHRGAGRPAARAARPSLDEAARCWPGTAPSGSPASARRGTSPPTARLPRGAGRRPRVACCPHPGRACPQPRLGPDDLLVAGLPVRPDAGPAVPGSCRPISRYDGGGRHQQPRVTPRGRRPARALCGRRAGAGGARDQVGHLLDAAAPGARRTRRIARRLVSRS